MYNYPPEGWVKLNEMTVKELKEKIANLPDNMYVFIMNWRDISKVGVPLDNNKSYLVTDGKECSTTNIAVRKNHDTGELTFVRWTGDENTYEDNQCCSGTPMFDLVPTHWIPTDEIPLP